MAKFFFFIIVIAGILFFAGHAFKQGLIGGVDGFFGTTTLPAAVSYNYSNASEDMIFITSPKPGESLTSTITITGFARGSWYFEGVFPIVVVNADGMTIGTGQGRADGEWTTNSFVAFTGEVDLKTPYTGVAQVVLKKDNTSGDPSRDASVSFPVRIQ